MIHEAVWPCLLLSNRERSVPRFRDEILRTLDERGGVITGDQLKVHRRYARTPRTTLLFFDRSPSVESFLLAQRKADAGPWRFWTLLPSRCAGRGIEEKPS